jgi:hypothetical protein
VPKSPVTISTRRKNKYLNNKELLAEIHKSKNTFSSYIAPEYSQYDLILPGLDKINIRTIADAKRSRAKKIGNEVLQTAKLAGNKTMKLSEATPDYKTIKKSDVIFRIMTYDHIPLAPGRKKTTKTVADLHEKLNFPPYQHWKFDEDNNLICVGKSHWKGGVHNGHFSKDHGRITENLGQMFIKLSERYAQRPNWRGYTYIEEMKGQALLQLSYIGLKFDESKSENPFAYYTAAVTNSFTKVFNLEKESQNIRDDILEEHGLVPSLTRQLSQEFSNEVSRQAKIYKSHRMKKSKDEDFNSTNQ